MCHIWNNYIRYALFLQNALQRRRILHIIYYFPSILQLGIDIILNNVFVIIYCAVVNIWSWLFFKRSHIINLMIYLLLIIEGGCDCIWVLLECAICHSILCIPMITCSFFKLIYFNFSQLWRITKFFDIINLLYILLSTQ